VADHGRRPLGKFLGGLEEENHVPCQFRPVGREEPGGAVKGGGVEVVAAGVHPVWDLGNDGLARRLLLFQSVDVGPEGHRLSRAAAPEESCYAGLHAQVDEREAKRGQKLLDPGGGAPLLEAYLRMAVEVVFQRF